MRFFTIITLSLLAITLVAPLLWGCSTTTAPRPGSASSPYATPSAESRSPLEAERLTLKAAGYIGHDDDRAEQLLREALAHDLYHGPAHCNLGVVFLNQGKLYEAANEFEWARKLMPGHPDPRMNLALTLERAGRYNDALATYTTALEVYPGHLPSMQAITRLQIRTGRTDSRTGEYLKNIALRGESEEWRDWARFQLTRSHGPR